MIRNIQKFTNSINKKVDNITARLERASSGNNNTSSNMPHPAVSSDDIYTQHRGYYYQHPSPHHHQFQQHQHQPPPSQAPPYNYHQPPPSHPPSAHGQVPPAPPPQDYYAQPPQHNEYVPPPPVSQPQPPINTPLPPELPLPEPLKRPSDHYLPMAYAGYPDAAVEASTGSGTPILPPHANTPSPPPTVTSTPTPPPPAPPPPTSAPTSAPASAPIAPAYPRAAVNMLVPPSEHASIAEKHAFILRISTIATVAVCGDLGVQPWFCVLKMDSDNVGGYSEEYHVDVESLLRANFGSIGLSTEGNIAQLVDEFTRRNSSIFEGYRCEVRSGTPAVLIERFANYHHMIDVYFRQAVQFANTALRFGAADFQHHQQPLPMDIARGHPAATATSLKFATVKDGAFLHVVDTVRRVKRVE